MMLKRKSFARRQQKWKLIARRIKRLGMTCPTQADRTLCLRVVSWGSRMPVFAVPGRISAYGVNRTEIGDDGARSSWR
jgi:hypothetical protein